MCKIGRLICVLAICAPFFSFVAGSNDNKLADLIEYNINQHVFPKTLRILLFENEKNSPFDWEYIRRQNNVPVLIGSKRPLLVGVDPRTVATGGTVGFYEQFRYVVLLYINDSNLREKMFEKLEMTVNRRWDRVIILTEKDQTLEEIISQKIISEFKVKFLMSLEKKVYWADPISYDADRMIKVNSVREIPEKKRMGGNLRGRHIKIAGTEFPPMMYKTVDAKGKEEFAGNFVNIHVVASRIFNYSYEMSYDPSYGEYWPNGTWTGMYSRVFYRDKGYHCTIGLGIVYDFSFGVDFGSMMNTLDLIFATNQPITRLEWYAFILPYSWVAWMWIFVTYLFYAVVQFIVMYLVHGRQVKSIVWDSSIFLPYAMVTEQGLNDIPKGARYLALIWLMGTLVLGTGYKSTLRNDLSFPKPEKIPLTFDELAKRKDYGITLLSLGSAERLYIEGTSRPAIVNLRNRMKYDPNPDSCVRNVFLNEHTVCIGWSFLVAHQSARSLTVNTRVEPLVFSKDAPTWVVVTMAFQKDSIFLDSFFGITEGTFESNLVAKWELEEYYKSKKNGIARLNNEKDTNLYKLLVQQTKAGLSDRHPLTMMNLWAIFAFLPLGFALGTLFFFIERCVASKQRNAVTVLPH